MPETIITRPCSNCEVIKTLSEFHKNKYGKYGRENQCIECRKAYKAAYYKTAASKARHKRYWAKNPEKKKATTAVCHAIRDGKLFPAYMRLCSCEKPAQEYHHIDYVSMGGLHVIPLCIKCHKSISHKG